MKNRLAFFLLLLVIKSGRAQSTREYLTGSWEKKFIEIEGQKSASGNETMSFYQDHSYQLLQHGQYTVSGRAVDTVYTWNASWEISADGSTLTITDQHRLTDNLRIPATEYSIALVNDSELLLGAYEGKTPVSIHYSRIPPRQKVIDTTRTIDAVQPQPAPQFYLVNSAKPSKRIAIKGDVQIVSNVNHSGHRTESETEGRIVAISDTAFLVGVSNEITSIYSDNDEFIRYSETVYSEPYEQRWIGLNTIGTFKYSSPARQSWNGTFIGILWLGIAQTTVVAPLASINYRHGGFNEQRYFKLAGIGLATVGVSIPVLIFSRKKTYKLTQTGMIVSKKYWQLTR
jgi:hypothetical protein